MYNIAEDTGLGKGWERMIFNTGSALLDAIVLAVVSREPEGTYGYKITQEVRQAIDLSESTLYPVLRRLQKDGCLEVYGIIGLRSKEARSFRCMKRNGFDILRR